MKKIPKSITVTVRNGENFRAVLGKEIWNGDGVTFGGDGPEWRTVSKFFPKTPAPPYRVTYTVNPRGKYIKWSGCLIRDIRTDEINRAMNVCFLPDSWRGLRVSRKVSKISGRTPKEGKK
jgi:hypothetical protein